MSDDWIEELLCDLSNEPSTAGIFKDVMALTKTTAPAREMIPMVRRASRRVTARGFSHCIDKEG